VGGLGRPGGFEEPPEFREVDLVQAIVDIATGRGWRIDVEVTIGLMRPDLLIRKDHRPALVVEVKRERGTVHFASLSQVAAYRTAVEDLTSRPVRAVLASTGIADEGIVPLARLLGVHLISLHGLAPRDAAESCVDQLAYLLDLPDEERSETSRLGDLTSERRPLQMLHRLLARGESRPEIASRMRLSQGELTSLYMGLLTQLETTDPEELDTVMRAWEQTT
jgi:hypothetical protein